MRMGRSLEDRALVVGQHLQPGLKVGGMIGPRLKLRCDAEIGAEEATPQLCDELLACALGLVLRVAREVSPDPGLWSGPMNIMPISA